jgi:hypothetical protein
MRLTACRVVCLRHTGLHRADGHVQLPPLTLDALGENDRRKGELRQDDENEMASRIEIDGSFIQKKEWQTHKVKKGANLMLDLKIGALAQLSQIKMTAKDCEVHLINVF